jgi:hypothetical protein
LIFLRGRASLLLQAGKLMKKEHIREMVSHAGVWDWILVFGIAGVGWYYLSSVDGGFKFYTILIAILFILAVVSNMLMEKIPWTPRNVIHLTINFIVYWFLNMFIIVAVLPFMMLLAIAWVLFIFGALFTGIGMFFAAGYGHYEMAAIMLVTFIILLLLFRFFSKNKRSERILDAISGRLKDIIMIPVQKIVSHRKNFYIKDGEVDFIPRKD